MKIRLILDAIDALNEARKMLRTGSGTIDQQMAVGNKCCESSCALRVVLEKECPEIKIEEEV